MPFLAVAEAREETVVLPSPNGAITGALALPSGGPAPVVLLLHGFTGSRDEARIPGTGEGIFSRTARLLSEKGVASLRIDFRSVSFEAQITEARAAVRYLRGLEAVKGASVHLLGWSQGGLVAASMAGRGETVKSVVLWQAVGDPRATYGRILGSEILARGMNAAAGDIVISVAGIPLNAAFFQGIATLC